MSFVYFDRGPSAALVPAAEELKSLMENLHPGEAPYEILCRMHPVLDSPSSSGPLQNPHPAKSQLSPLRDKINNQ